MPNPLTGDFEAALQVSGGTINRLAATMHQNASAASDLPRFPHSLFLRIGDDRAIDGVRGSVQAQVGVPRIELLHGSTDRFILEVGVRARYKPDPGTTPLPAFIHGTVRAEYRIRDIDPKCFGWARAGANYLWVRVVRDSVRFQGTAEDDRNALLVTVSPGDAAATRAANEAKITKQIARLLATRFAARPHPVSKHFRRGWLRSLNAPIGGSAVAMPVGLSGEPSGQISSIDNLILEDADFAIGVSRDYIMSLAEPALAAMRGFNPTIPVHVHVSTPWPAPDIDIRTVYRVHVDPPTVEWQPHGSFAVIKIKTSGSVKTDSILPNATFDVDQDIVINFDAGGEVLWLSAGSRTVIAHVTGLGSGIIANAVKNAVANAVKSMVQSACSQAQPSLDAMISRKQELIDQLRTIDDQAYASVNEALFLRDGLILRGAIALTGRRAAVADHEKTLEKDGFTAIESWIPGGRIDTFEWSWTWAGQSTSGRVTHGDRFVLRRPPVKAGRWGTGIGLSQPLPGIDGSGTVCLKIKGVQVDAVTGQLAAVESVSRCMRFGIHVSIFGREDRIRLFLRDVPVLSEDVPFPELALIAMEGADRSAAANTLLVYMDRAWDDEVASTLRSALEGTRRDDAGLVLLVLFREGVLGSVQSRLVEQVEEMGRNLGIHTLVNEDVLGGWSTAYAFRSGGEQSWRLLSPAGGVTWAHQGRLTAKELASALERCLIPSPPARPTFVRVGAAVGAQVSATALYPGIADILDEVESECPPITLGRLGVGETVVSFVQRGSLASEAQLRKLSSRYGQREDGPVVVVVVDAANVHETERMKNELGLDFATIPDRRGTITNRFGIRIWPTTITLDHAGIISALEIGGSTGREGAHEPGYGRNNKGEDTCTTR